MTRYASHPGGHAAVSAAGASVRVAAPARLHLGMVDVGGDGSRLYGGLGVGIEAPSVVVRAQRAEQIAASGPGAERARGFAAAALSAFALPGGVHVEVEQEIPPHHGLGSGTKLGLAVARAVAALHQRPATTLELAAAVARGERSAVGLWTFDAPGLVLEGGPRRDRGGVGPLLGRWRMPSQWRCVLARPHGTIGISGEQERAFFEAPQRSDPAAVSQLVLTGLLPALVEQDVDEFGRALSEIQRIVGTAFATAQGGMFHPRAGPLVERMTRLGVPGVGQSSWGPIAYGIVGDPERADWVAAQLNDELGEAADVRALDFDRRGVSVERA